MQVIGCQLGRRPGCEDAGQDARMLAERVADSEPGSCGDLSWHSCSGAEAAALIGREDAVQEGTTDPHWIHSISLHILIVILYPYSSIWHMRGWDMGIMSGFNHVFKTRICKLLSCQNICTKTFKNERPQANSVTTHRFEPHMEIKQFVILPPQSC